MAHSFRTYFFIVFVSFTWSVSVLASEKTELPLSSLHTEGVDRTPHCRKASPSLQQMRQELEEMSQQGPFRSTGVGGLALENENTLLVQAYRELNSYKTYQARPTQDFDYWHLFKDGSCKKALCAIEKTYGPERGVIYLYVMAKYGVNLSHLGYDKLKLPSEADRLLFESYFLTREWKLEELGPYLQAVWELPAHLTPLFPIRMTHAGIVHRTNPNILSNGTIQFYTPMDAMKDSQKERTTFHELAHTIGSRHALDTSAEWIRISGWYLLDGKPTQRNPEAAPSRYAQQDLFEDFAESFVFYRYEPEILLQKSPERYFYMKENVFKGKEYLVEKSCP